MPELDEIHVEQCEHHLEWFCARDNGDVEVAFDDGPFDGIIVLPKDGFKVFAKAWLEKFGND